MVLKLKKEVLLIMLISTLIQRVIYLKVLMSIPVLSVFGVMKQTSLTAKTHLLSLLNVAMVCIPNPD